MNILIILLVGMLLAYLPGIFDAIFSLVITCLKTLEQKIAVKLAKYQKEIYDLSDEESPPQRAIGFAISTEEEEDLG